MVFVIVLSLLTLWVVGAIVLALLTGGVIHEREEHDRPYGGNAYSERAVRRRRAAHHHAVG